MLALCEHLTRYCELPNWKTINPLPTCWRSRSLRISLSFSYFSLLTSWILSVCEALLDSSLSATVFHPLTHCVVYGSLSRTAPLGEQFMPQFAADTTPPWPPLSEARSAALPLESMRCSYIWLLRRSLATRLVRAALRSRLWAASIRRWNALLLLSALLFGLSIFSHWR